MGIEIYRSSAGSGKTFQLTCEYLTRALKSRDGFRQILAVTFTNKATDEIKTRIISTLAAFAEPPEKHSPSTRAFYTTVRERLAQDNINESESDFRKNARQTLRAILHQYPNFAVQTIDGFFQKIVRAFSRELNLPHGYEIELDQKRAQRDSIVRILDQSGDGAFSEIREWLVEFARRQIQNGKSWNVRRPLGETLNELFKETFYTLEPNPFENARVDSARRLYESLRPGLNEYRQSARNIETRARILFRLYDVEAEHCYYGSKGGIYSYLNSFRQKSKDKPGPRIQKLLEEGGDFVTKGGARRLSANPDLKTLLAEAYQFVVDNRPEYLATDFIAKNLFMLGLLQEGARALEEYRAIQKKLLLSDAARFIRGVTREVDAPFVYEKMGAVYRHFLLDEFQDTSLFQWENVRPLLENGLSEGGDVLIVGDPKQGIYRFRGAHSEIFHQIIGEWNPPVSQKEIKVLGTNFRSAKNIVRFNNTFFAAASIQYPLLAAAYQSSAQYGRRETEGVVQIRATTKEDRLAELLPVIEKARNDGFKLKDVAILTRGTKEADETARFLQNAGLYVLTSSSFLVGKSPRVRLLINALRYLSRPDDGCVLAELIWDFLSKDFLTYPARENSTDKIADSEIEYRAKGLQWAKETFARFSATPPDERTRFAAALLPPAFWNEKATLTKLPLYELCVELIDKFALTPLPPAYLSALKKTRRKTRADERYREADAYVVRFLDEAFAYSARKDDNPNGFLEFWDEIAEKLALPAPSSADAIRCMTIHKAKGLEFPVVLIPFADWILFKSPSTLWVKAPPRFTEEFVYLPLVEPSKSLADTCFGEEYQEEINTQFIDNVNLLYVALTRAVDRLYVWYEIKKSAGPKKPDEPETKRISTLLTQTLTNAPTFDDETLFLPSLKDYLDVEGNFYLGETQETTQETHGRESATPNARLTRFVYNPWRKKLSVKTRALSPEAGPDKLIWGTILHDVFARLETGNDLDAVLEDFRMQGYFSAVREAEIRRTLSAALSLPEVENWFSPDWRVYAERDIVMANGRVLRPDRVLIQNENAVVVDFKSGAPAPDEHAPQLLRYAEALRQIGYQHIGAFVLYLAEPVVVEIPI